MHERGPQVRARLTAARFRDADAVAAAQEGRYCLRLKSMVRLYVFKLSSNYLNRRRALEFAILNHSHEMFVEIEMGKTADG